jgi:RNA polymerase sigma factor (sigma-70 family)
VLQAGRGNAKAQAALYNQFSKAMFNICMRMAGSRLQAEDMLHDAFLLAFKSIGQLKQPEAVAGWLRRLVVNECIRQTKNRLHWDDWGNEHDGIADDVGDWWQGISLEMVHHEIKNLPDGCRQVFVLYALEDYSHREIAASLGISESTSKSQYHRSRTLLRERILKQMKLADG